MCLSLSLVSCSDDDPTPGGNGADPIEADAKYVGQAVGNFDKSEWYPGGELGTTDNVASGCYEDENSSSASLHLQLQDSADWDRLLFAAHAWTATPTTVMDVAWTHS